jgi:hypothetical protein
MTVNNRYDSAGNGDDHRPSEHLFVWRNGRVAPVLMLTPRLLDLDLSVIVMPFPSMKPIDGPLAVVDLGCGAKEYENCVVHYVFAIDVRQTILQIDKSVITLVPGCDFDLVS